MDKVPSTEKSRDNPAAAKRPKLETSADDDEDISIIEERINIRPPQATGDGSPTNGASRPSDGDAGEDNQDSKIAEFRNQMLKFEAEASHLRTQLKREQEKAQNAEREKVKAEGVKHYLEEKWDDERKRANDAKAVAQQKAEAAEKKATELQKQCDRLVTKVQSKEAEIEYRDKQLGNAAKDLNEARKKATDAEKEAAEARKKATDVKEVDANARANACRIDANVRVAAAEAKVTAAEKEASDMRQKLSELKKRKAEAKQRMKITITALENRLANAEDSEQPSSSTDERPGEALREANKRVADKEKEITILHADNDKLKKELTASKAKATRAENLRKKSVQEKDDEILGLNNKIVVLRDLIKDLNKRAFPERVLNACLETERMQQAIRRFDGIADKIVMKWHPEGLAIMSTPSRPTLPKVLLELKASFLGEFSCNGTYLVQTDYSLLSKGFASQAEKEQCRLRKEHGRMMVIEFKSAGEPWYDPAMTFIASADDDLQWTVVEENAPYACIFDMNSFVLAQAARNLSPVLLEFSNRGQPAAVIITDSEVRLGGGQEEHVWRSLPVDNPHANDFKAEFSSTAPDTNLRIYVDPKYLRRCVMASSGGGSKTVEVAISEDILRLRYGNEHFSLTCYIPTVKSDDSGERCYSPIEFRHDIFEI